MADFFRKLFGKIKETSTGIVDPETGNVFQPATDAEAVALASPREKSIAPVVKLAGEGKPTVLENATGIAVKQLTNKGNLVSTENATQGMGSKG